MIDINPGCGGIRSGARGGVRFSLREYGIGSDKTRVLEPGYERGTRVLEPGYERGYEGIGVSGY